MGFSEILTIVFVILKLIGTIDWSWWLVLLPEIIAFAFYALLIILNIVSAHKIHKAAQKRFKKHFGEWGI